MKVGLISDVHGNRVALEAVLEDMPAVDALACAGDVVGYNPWPGDCVDALRERDVPTVMGNHDEAVVGRGGFRFNGMAKAGVDHAREVLDDGQLEWLRSLPTERLEFDGRVKLVHGHPDDPHRYTYPEEFSPRLLGEGDDTTAGGNDREDDTTARGSDREDVLVMGHTHVQHAERYAEGIVVNPGSVGQPRDRDPRAAYAVVDLAAMTVDTHRVEYDVERVQEAIDAAGLPDRLGSRLARGR